MTSNGVTFTEGPRIVWWSCHKCGTANEWREDWGTDRACWLCQAEHDETAHGNGIYTVTDIGAADVPWRVER